jgi:hypothetical protein
VAVKDAHHTIQAARLALSKRKGSGRRLLVQVGGETSAPERFDLARL